MIMVPLRKKTEGQAEQAKKPVYPARPVAGEVDTSALRKAIMARFPKIRAHLGK